MSHRSYSPARILIIEDHELLAHSLQLALGAEGMSVTAASLEPEAILATAAQVKPDVVLLDLDLGPAGGDGADLVEPLAKSGARVIVVSGSEDPVRIATCVERGAYCFHSKSLSLEDLLNTVRKVAAGEQVLSDHARQSLMAGLRLARSSRRREMAPFDALTNRESFVLAQLVDGRSATSIAEIAYVSEATVRTQIRAVLTKLGVKSQLAAVAAARRVGWRPESSDP